MHQSEPVMSSSERFRFALALTFLLALILFVACGGCGARQYTAPGDLPTTSDPGVVKMKMVDKDGDSATCTAWKIGDDRIMTAGHCCDDTTVAYWGTGPHAVAGEMFEVIADNDDDDYDVCVMRGHIDGAPIHFAHHDPATGERVWTEGYPNGIFLISEGVWSGRNGNRAVASVTSFPGASGSPVLNADGEAVGLIIEYVPPQDNIAYMSPLERMKTMKFLAK